MDETLDLVGLNCPLPVLKTRRVLTLRAPGSRLIVRASDPMAAIDIPHMCAVDGHDLVELTRDGEVLVFVLVRGRA